MSLKRKKELFNIWKDNNNISRLINIFNRNIQILKKQQLILEKYQSI